MQISQEEMKKACDIAMLEMKKHIEQFKPDKPAIKDKQGWICEKVYLGSSDDKLAFSFSLQWNYSIAGSIGRAYEVVHVRLLCLSSERGRALRLDDMHKPAWNTEKKCTLCTGFNERQVIEADTSLHEY